MANDPTKPTLSLLEVAQQSEFKINDPYSSAGRKFNFDPKGADRYLTYGSKAYGTLGYNPFRDNEKKYQQETSWTKDISRGFNGMVKLAGVGLSDTFAFGAFGNEDNHKDFGKIMQDYGSQRGGLTGFWANTQLSAGYTVGILSAVAAEELALAAVTFLSGGTSAPATGTLMASEAARAGSLLGKAGTWLAKADNKIGVLANLRNIENARWYHNGISSFGKAILPFGSTADYLRMFKPQELIKGKDFAKTAAQFKELNGLTKSVMGAAALARDARKFYLSHSESDLEAKFVRDEIIDEASNKWYKANPGMKMPEEVRKHIEARGLEGYKKTYETNFGLIYLTNAIAFEGLFKGFSPTNKLFRTIGNYSVKGAGADVVVEALEPTIKNYIKKSIAGVTWTKGIGTIVRGSMEGVQEYGQDVISSAAKKYAGVKFGAYGDVIVNGSADDMSRGAYWNQVANSLGDSSLETFMSGALMGIFASPVNFATKLVNEYSFGEKGFGSEYNQWTQEGRKKYKALWQERVDNAKILTEFFKTQGLSFEADVKSPAHRMIGLREELLTAAKEGNRKIYEDKKQEIFQLNAKLLFQTGTHTELIDHLDQMLGYSVEELNQSLDRTDITEENKTEYLNKIKQRKEDILYLKKEFDRIEEEMPSKGSINKIFRDETLSPEEKQERALNILAWDNLKEEMLFNGDKVRNYAERKKGILNKVKSDTNLTDLDLAALTNINDLEQQVELLTQQVESNKEYKLDNTKEHKQAELKLQALKEFQKGLETLNDSKFDNTNETSVKEVFDTMETAFTKYLIASDSQYTSISNDVLNATKAKVRRTKQFNDLFDYYQLDKESQELQYYGDLLNDPEAATRWLKANKEQLVALGNNKQQYIEDTIEAWQTREVSDDMLSDLLDAGIVFSLDELDDIFNKSVMPTKIYDAVTHKELTPERYKEAIKIIEKYYKKLKGKKITASRGNVNKGRTKVKSDKRRANQLVNAYAGRNKLNTPIDIKVFIEKLLAQGTKYLTLTEIQILEKFKNLNFNNQVILTDEALSPITFNEEGNLVIDVRYGAADYQANDVPFEIVAISGIVQNIFKSRLEENESLVEDITSIMNEAKVAYLSRISQEIQNPQELEMKIATISSSPLFTDPLTFIAESFSNKEIQEFLSSIKSDVDASNLSIWKGLRNALRTDLENGAFFDQSLLDALLGVTQLNLSEQTIEEISESPSVVEFELERGTTEVSDESQESTFAEPVDFSTEEITEEEQDLTLEDQIKNIKKKINLLNAELNATKGIRIFKVNRLTKEINALNVELNDLLKQQKAQDVQPIETPTDVDLGVNNEIKEEVDDQGKVIITSATPFKSMPFELQYLLAKQYFLKNLYQTSVKLPILPNIKWDKDNAGIQAAQEAFNQEQSYDAEGNLIVQAYFEKEYTEKWKAWLESLNEETIKLIEQKLHLNSYKDIIGEFNKNNTKVEDPIIEEEEEDFDKPIPPLWNDIAEEKLNQAKTQALANIKIVDNKASTTFTNHFGEQETIIANSEPALRNIINETFSLTGWANNTNNIVGKTFNARIGDQETEVQIIIEKVRLLKEGDLHIIASRTDRQTSKVYSMYVRLNNGRILSYKNKEGISYTADRLDFIKDFFGVKVEPFDPTLKTKNSSPGTGPLFQMPTSVQDIISEFVGIDKYFSENELKVISEELSNIKNSKEYAQYLVDVQDALNQRIEDSLKKPTQQTPASAKKTDLGFEEVSNQITNNWKVLSDKTFYQYTGTNVALAKKYTDKKSWTINSRDVDYIRAVHFSLFKNTKEDFLNAVLEKLYEIDSFADTVKTIDLRQPTEEVEEKVKAYLYSALQQGLAGSKVITALNKKLSASGSTKVIKYTIKSKNANTIVEIVDKSPSQLKPKINKARELTQEVRDYFMSQDDYLTDDQAMYLIYDVLRTRRLHPDILGDIVGRVGKSDLAAYKSLLSSKSKFKKADEFGDAVLDGYTIASGKSRADLVIELLSSNNKLSQMKDYFEGRYLMAKEDADKDLLSDEELYEKWLANSGLSLANIAATDYENSIEYKILTGQFKGDYKSLTDKQKSLYNESGLYEIKNEVEDSFEDFLKKRREEESQFEINKSKFYENFNSLPRIHQVKNMFELINKNASFEELVYMYQLINQPFFTNAMRLSVRNAINTVLGPFQNFYMNKPLITVDLSNVDVNGNKVSGTYFIVPSQTQTQTSLGIRVKNVSTNKEEVIQLSDFIDGITKIYEPGEVVNNQTIDVSLNSEDINEIKTSITDIFSKFNSSVSEFENLENQELLNQITEEFNKCK